MFLVNPVRVLPIPWNGVKMEMLSPQNYRTTELNVNVLLAATVNVYTVLYSHVHGNHHGNHICRATMFFRLLAPDVHARTCT